MKNPIVLCVDDDPDDQMLLLDTIRELNPLIRVASALNGTEALRFLRESKKRNELPCLVILDINMPLMDGRQTLSQIKKEEGLDKVPVVMFTTSSSAIDINFCAQYGVPLITKPGRQKDYLEAIKTLLKYSNC